MVHFVACQQRDAVRRPGSAIPVVEFQRCLAQPVEHCRVVGQFQRYRCREAIARQQVVVEEGAEIEDDVAEAQAMRRLRDVPGRCHDDGVDEVEDVLRSHRAGITPGRRLHDVLETVIDEGQRRADLIVDQADLRRFGGLVLRAHDYRNDAFVCTAVGVLRHIGEPVDAAEGRVGCVGDGLRTGVDDDRTVRRLADADDRETEAHRVVVIRQRRDDDGIALEHADCVVDRQHADCRPCDDENVVAHGHAILRRHRRCDEVRTHVQRYRRRACTGLHRNPVHPDGGVWLAGRGRHDKAGHDIRHGRGISRRCRGEHRREGSGTNLQRDQRSIRGWRSRDRDAVSVCRIVGCGNDYVDDVRSDAKRACDRRARARNRAVAGWCHRDADDVAGACRGSD